MQAARQACRLGWVDDLFLTRTVQQSTALMMQAASVQMQAAGSFHQPCTLVLKLSTPGKACLLLISFSAAVQAYRFLTCIVHVVEVAMPWIAPSHVFPMRCCNRCMLECPSTLTFTLHKSTYTTHL